MNSYIFEITAVPIQKHRSYPFVKCAEFLVWVVIPNVDVKAAQQKAIDYMAHLYWKPNIKRGYLITGEQLSDLSDTENNLYQTALQDGVASTIIAVSQKAIPNSPT